jgi:hypothetical protein
MAYLLFFLAGFFGANAVPHYVKGVTGEKHMTPFAKPSSASVNIVWGTANFFAALWLFHWALQRDYDFGPMALAVAAGILALGLILAKIWENDPKAKGQR